MMVHPRPWVLTLALAVALGLTAQGSALAAPASRTDGAAAHGLAASQPRPAAALTTCAEIRAHRNALMARGQTRATCITQRTSENARPASRARAAGLFCAINRFDICTNSTGTINVINLSNGQTVGQLNYTLQQDIVLNPNSLTFGENYNMNFTSGGGNILGMTVGLARDLRTGLLGDHELRQPSPGLSGREFRRSDQLQRLPRRRRQHAQHLPLDSHWPWCPGRGSDPVTALPL